MLSVVADPSMARQKWREPEHLQHPLPETMDSPLRRLSGADSSRREDTSLAMIARRRASTADKTGKKKQTRHCPKCHMGDTSNLHSEPECSRRVA